MTNWMSYRLARLQETVGDVQVDHITTFEQLDFTKGEVDLAIRNGDHQDVSLFSETICEEWWAPMASLKIAVKIKDPSELLAMPLIEARHPREPKGHPSLLDWLEANGVTGKPRNVQLVPHTETAMQLVADGMGVKLCSNVLSSSWIKSEKIAVPFKTAIRRKGIRYRLICRFGEEDTEPIAAVRKFLHTEFAAMSKKLDAGIDEVYELPSLN